MRLIQVTMLRVVEEKLVEKRIHIVAAAVGTLESDMLKFFDRLIPVTFMQCSHNGMGFSIHVKETLDVMVTKVEDALYPPQAFMVIGEVENVPKPS